ncbi:MAG: TonB-dependent receptor, partial [Chitinophagaceae bacterium]
GRRLRRPYIWDLNPFVSNIDSLNIRYGNPDLGPEMTNTGELGYTVLKGKTSISMRFIQAFNNRQIINYTSFDEQSGITSALIANAGVNRATTFVINLSTKVTKLWSLSAGANGRYVRIRNRFDKSQDNHGVGGYLNINSSYQVTPQWSASVSGFVSRPDVQLQGQSGYFRSYNASTSYKLFKNKITIAVSANNFFTKYFSYISRSSDVNFKLYSENRNLQRSVNMSVRWNFGKLSESVSRKRGINNDDLKAQ